MNISPVLRFKSNPHNPYTLVINLVLVSYCEFCIAVIGVIPIVWWNPCLNPHIHTKPTYTLWQQPEAFIMGRNVTSLHTQ